MFVLLLVYENVSVFQTATLLCRSVGGDYPAGDYPGSTIKESRGWRARRYNPYYHSVALLNSVLMLSSPSQSCLDANSLAGTGWGHMLRMTSDRASQPGGYGAQAVSGLFLC